MINKRERSLYEDIKNIKKLIDRAELELIKIRGFLTLEEAEERAFYFYEYQENAYYYEIDETSNSGVLIENEEVLVEGVDDGRWYEPGVYKYKIAGRGWTLIENGEVLIDGAYDCHWCENGMYRYYNKNGNKFEVKDGITTKI